MSNIYFVSDSIKASNFKITSDDSEIATDNTNAINKHYLDSEISGLSDVYLTKTDAASTYETISEADTKYLEKNGTAKNTEKIEWVNTDTTNSLTPSANWLQIKNGSTVKALISAGGVAAFYNMDPLNQLIFGYKLNSAGTGIEDDSNKWIGALENIANSTYYINRASTPYSSANKDQIVPTFKVLEDNYLRMNDSSDTRRISWDGTIMSMRSRASTSDSWVHKIRINPGTPSGTSYMTMGAIYLNNTGSSSGNYVSSILTSSESSISTSNNAMATGGYLNQYYLEKNGTAKNTEKIEWIYNNTTFSLTPSAGILQLKNGDTVAGYIAPSNGSWCGTYASPLNCMRFGRKMNSDGSLIEDPDKWNGYIDNLANSAYQRYKSLPPYSSAEKNRLVTTLTYIEDNYWSKLEDSVANKKWTLNGSGSPDGFTCSFDQSTDLKDIKNYYKALSSAETRDGYNLFKYTVDFKFNHDVSGDETSSYFDNLTFSLAVSSIVFPTKVVKESVTTSGSTMSQIVHITGVYDSGDTTTGTFILRVCVSSNYTDSARTFTMSDITYSKYVADDIALDNYLTMNNSSNLRRIAWDGTVLYLQTRASTSDSWTNKIRIVPNGIGYSSALGVGQIYLTATGSTTGNYASSILTSTDSSVSTSDNAIATGGYVNQFYQPKPRFFNVMLAPTDFDTVSNAKQAIIQFAAKTNDVIEVNVSGSFNTNGSFDDVSKLMGVISISDLDDNSYEGAIAFSHDINTTSRFTVTSNLKRQMANTAATTCQLKVILKRSDGTALTLSSARIQVSVTLSNNYNALAYTVNPQ